MSRRPKRLRRLAVAAAIVLLPVFVAGNALLWPFTDYFAGRDSHCSAQAMALLERPQQMGLHVATLPCAGSRCLLFIPRKDAMPDARGQRVREQLPAYGASLRPYGELRGIVVMLHGKGSCKENQLYTALRLTAAGLAVIAPDLPAHGDNPLNQNGYGTLPHETEIAVAALDAARDYLDAKLPAALWGHSMGSSYANYTVAAHPERFAALVIQSGFARMDDVLRDHLPPIWQGLAAPLSAWFKQLVQWRGGVDVGGINPVEAAASHQVPVLQIHGARDRLILAARGEALFQAYRGEKDFIMVADGDHNDVMMRATPVYAPAAAFLLRHLE